MSSTTARFSITFCRLSNLSTWSCPTNGCGKSSMSSSISSRLFPNTEQNFRRNPMKSWRMSNINKQLEVYNNQGNPDQVAGDFGRHSLYKMLGYFSLVGLLRLHSLLGDYYQAIKVLENIELNKKSMYSRVPACQITTYYYVGFAYMMMRRYADAIRTFSNILVYIQRTKAMFQTRNYQNDQINKQTEQMYTLLAICMVLHPQRIDEAVQSSLREKSLAEKMSRMSRGDSTEFTNCFTFACPKFLSPVPPAYDTPSANFHKEPFQQQLKVFLDEVQQQQQISVMRSYLKLY